MPRNPFSLRRSPTAFTLVELIISIGMVLILMTGVVKVFKYATDAVGSGLAVSNIVRAQRSLNTLIPADAQGLSINPANCPAILLDSQENTPPAAFTPGTANTFDTTQADNTYGTVLGPCFVNKTTEATPYANLTLSDTQYRQDTFSFFAKAIGSANFTRQTGNDGTFVNPMTSNWAWIWYGQLWLPTNALTTAAPIRPSFLTDNNSIPSYPGVGTSASNPNNFYASQWSLGRVAILLAERNSAGNVISGYWAGTGNPKYQGYINNSYAKLDPLAYGSNTYNTNSGFSTSFVDNYTSSTSTTEGTNTNSYQIQQSRYDLATVAYNTGDPFADYFQPNLTTANYPNWYVPVVNMALAPTSVNSTYQLNYRFQANPFPIRPLSGTDITAGVGTFSGGSAKSAQTVPVVASGCVRFYVEYAGDFVNQNQNGTVNTLKADGVTPNPGWNVAVAAKANVTYVGDGTDFYVDPSGVRHIRWYGLPRSVTGSPTPDTTDLNGNTFQTADVLPLAYYCSNPPSATNVTAATIAPFEQVVTNFPFTHYICAWDSTTGSIRPTMFRITIELIDADGRLTSPRVLQYILPVAQS